MSGFTFIIRDNRIADVCLYWKQLSVLCLEDDMKSLMYSFLAAMYGGRYYNSRDYRVLSVCKPARPYNEVQFIEFLIDAID